jgi:peptidoglycan/LPS O-acetylase OafA/YrhL
MTSTSTHSSGFSYRPALDGVRAFAVLSVLAYHLRYGWAAGGFLGVDTFFVLSGYLITSLLIVEHARKGAISLGGFWLRRAKRLLPAVLVVLYVVGAYAALVAHSDRLTLLRRDSLATLLYVANWHFIRSGASYFDLLAEPSPLRHMWSLAIEEQFYLAWPLIVFGCLRLARGRHRVLATVAVAGAAASIAVMAVQYRAADPSRAYFGTDARAHSLLIGALAALVLAHWAPSGRRAAAGLQVAGLAGAGAVLWSYWRVSDTGHVFYRGGSPLFDLCVAVVIAAAVQGGVSPLRSVLSRQPLRWIGQVSYGLYLWHWPMIVWLTPQRVGVDGLGLDAVRVAATFAVTAVSYYVVERPIRFGVRPARRVVMGAAGAMALCAAVLVGATTGATTNRFEVKATTRLDPETVRKHSRPAEIDRRTVEEIERKVEPPADVAPPPWVHKVAMVGDSVAVSISDGLNAAFDREGITFTSSAFPGCGIAAGFMLDDKGQPFEWSAPCEKGVAAVQEGVARDDRPDIVLWHSTWEMAGRRGPNGEWLRPKTAAHRAALLGDMEAAFDRVTAAGARVVFLLPAPVAENPRRPADTGKDGKLAYYDSVIREFVGRHPGRATYVDLTPIVCPGGMPCPAVVDGVRLRPEDGGHFGPEGSVWLALHLVPKIWEAAATLPPPAG